MSNLEQPSVQPHRKSDYEAIKELTGKRLRQLLERAGEPVVQGGVQVAIAEIDPNLVKLGIQYLCKLDGRDPEESDEERMGNLFAPNGKQG